MRKVIFFVFLSLVVSEMANSQPGRHVPISPAIRHDWDMGIVNIPEAGYGLGVLFPATVEKYNFFSLTNITGYQFNRNIKAGLGYGVLMHDNDMLFPLFCDMRANLNSQGVVPFLEASGGVEFNPPHINNDSRIFISGMLGLHFVTVTKLSTNLSAGLHINAGGSEEKTTFIVVKLGIEIKGKRNDTLK